MQIQLSKSKINFFESFAGCKGIRPLSYQFRLAFASDKIIYPLLLRLASFDIVISELLRDTSFDLFGFSAACKLAFAKLLQVYFSLLYQGSFWLLSNFGLMEPR
jgi:hypothetical protein